MTKMKQKCDAAVCYGSSGTRCPLVRCELCSKSAHTKCANITNTLHKSLRDTPGLCWLCSNCRDSTNRNPDAVDTMGLVLQRTTSTLKLVGVLVESMQQLCRIFAQTSSNTCQPNSSQIINARDLERTLGEAFQDAINSTKLFESFIGDKRQRTSSLSGQSTSPPDKIARVDVPISNSPMTITTNSTFSDAAGVSNTVVNAAVLAAALAAAGRTVDNAANPPTITDAEHTTGGNTSPRASTSAATLIVTAERAAALAVEQTNVRAAKLAAELAAAHASQLASAQAAVHAAEHTATQVARQAAEQVAAQAAAHATELAAAQAAAVAAEQAVALASEQTAANQAAAYAAGLAAAQQAASLHATTLVTEQAAPARLPAPATGVPAPQNTTIFNQHAPLPMEVATTETIAHVAQPVVLAVFEATTSTNQPAAPAVHDDTSHKWYYISKFKPTETTENVIRYTQGKTNCDPQLILCHKLARTPRSNDRPLSFVSFKICVPEAFENVICSEGFWSAGVTIKPFLEKRPRLTPIARIRSESRARGAPRSPAKIARPAKQKPLAPAPVTPAIQAPITQHPYMPAYLPQFHPFQLAPPMLPQYQLAPPNMRQLGIPHM